VVLDENEVPAVTLTQSAYSKVEMNNRKLFATIIKIAGDWILFNHRRCETPAAPQVKRCPATTPPLLVNGTP
jgi:hypothetical protein